ncbi:alpha/beta hydrolase [Flavisolibacter tropicus]|uniref:XynC protein n=1 Tax=Flavisolibacter tropicus TaxID=1492898 RepID=A0A172U0A3_9BACT|nr:alpha/beta hydrolase family protein [Flavisolibacter tropicus]ANE52781.1 XynC protein [Flavisolibacter tropicus]
MRTLFLLVCSIIISTFAKAGTVDTVTIRSNSMRKDIKCVVIKPDTYKNKNNHFPTIYLLHGYSGGFWNWITRVPELQKHADTYQVLIVCPDGDYAGWYLDSPVDSSMRYETYIANEVPAYIEATYRTIKDRKARAITGLSMGGHGGLFLGFRHADFFGACGSMSGALSIEHITNKYRIEKLLGDTTNKALWHQYSIMGQMDHYPKDSIAIIMDCGTEDFIIEMSRMAHQKMLQLKIPHDYTERPGKHDWTYWGTAVEYQLLYFRNYFDRNGVSNAEALKRGEKAKEGKM